MASKFTHDWNPLPPKVHQKHGSYYLVHKNKWYPLGSKIISAKAEHLRLAEEFGIPVVHREFLANLYEKTKARAKRLGREFDFPMSEFVTLWEASKGRCALTGIKFDVGNAPGYRRRPWVPSVDRIDSKLGYIPGNVRLICCAMNTALSEYGDAVFEKIARAYIDRSPHRL